MSVTSQLLTTFLVNALWQIPVIAGITALCALLLRTAPSSSRYLLWVAALGLCLLLPLASLRHASNFSSGVRSNGAQIRANGDADGEFPSVGSHQPFSFTAKKHVRPVQFAPYLKWILLLSYLASLFDRTIRIALSLWRTLRFRDASYPRALPASLSAIVERSQNAFALRDIPITCSPDALGPVTISFPRPMLILPTRFFTLVSESDFSSALCHELAHIKRHDFHLNLACEILSVPIAFHPAAIWIKNRMAVSRELACDEAAVAKLYTRAGYARSLLNIAESLHYNASDRQSNWALGLFDTDTLEERIMNLLKKTKRLSNPWGIALGIIAAAVLAIGCLGVSAFSFQVAQPAPPSSDLQSFVGTWTAAFEDAQYLVLDLRPESGKLAGGIKVCSFQINTEASRELITITDKTFTESLPIRNLQPSQKFLSFDWRDPDGDENHLKFELTGSDTATLTWIGLPKGLHWSIHLSKSNRKAP